MVDILWSAQWSATDQVRVAVARDVTHTKQTLERLQRIAFFDPLTGLPNRQLFRDRLHMAMSRVRRETRQLAVLFIDLDKFKQVNDVFGHLVGDQLLIDVAERLKHQVRETDTVARFGGDEFVLLIDSVETSDQVHRIADKVVQALRQPFTVKSERIPMPASIGLAMYPVHGDSAEALLHHADSAMYRAKKAGGNQVHD
ncbi:MAG: putative signaling protein [Pseudidiomarina mangrovi]|nr:MAG: putative signaling protein [Pseudidiomarina mangrovi]